MPTANEADLCTTGADPITPPSSDAGVGSEQVVWRDECTIGNVGEHMDQLCRALDSGRPIALEMSAVSRIDTACLQLLVALMVDAARLERPVHWLAASPVVLEAARLAGVSGLLGFPEDRTGPTP